jgi:hypothetical protein
MGIVEFSQQDSRKVPPMFTIDELRFFGFFGGLYFGFLIRGLL